MRKKFSTAVFTFIVLILLADPVLAESPWECKTGETVINGTFLKEISGVITVKTPSGILALPLDSVLTCALMGTQSGKLVQVQEFPPGLDVEVILTVQGKARAMRNLPPPAIASTNKLLPGWGLEASLSPAGSHYLLFNFEQGLILYSREPNIPPFFLSSLPTAAWDREGKKIACAAKEQIIIYTLSTRHKQTFPLPSYKGITTVVTAFSWSPSGDKLLYASLCDYPNQGSDLFQLTLLSQSGHETAGKIVPNLGSILLLNDGLVLFTTYSDIEQTSGTAFLWNTQTDEMIPLLSGKKGGYRNLAYNHNQDILAYTVPNGLGEDLYFMDVSRHSSALVQHYALPIRNLQWSQEQTLYYWEEFTNTIFEIGETGPTAICPGYLPSQGVGKGFVHFCTEPAEKPQELFIKTQPANGHKVEPLNFETQNSVL